MDHDRYSDDSEGSDPHRDRFLPVDDRDLTRHVQRSPSPSSGTNSSTADGHHGHGHHIRRGGDRHAEVLKMLMNEEQAQSRSTRKFLRTALARLDNETLRAQKAEQHALEIAQRFKVISDAHQQMQRELARVNEELRLYKVEYSNAERELDRGREIIKVLENQRDEAEKRAAKDRTTARKLKEEQLMLRAREEGRKAGYAEGLRRGIEQARFERMRSDGEESGPEPDSAVPDSQSDPLDDLGVRNLTSPSANHMTIESPVPHHIIPPLSTQPAGEQGSRFHEHGIGATPNPDTASLASTTRPWQGGRPVSVQNASSFQHPETAIPPDGWIPPSDEDGMIRMPPPHELQRPHSPRSPSQPLPPLRPPSVAMDRGGGQQQPNGADYSYSRDRRNSVGSIPLSIPSTTISQFDLVSAPGDHDPNRKSGLSVIHEVSSSMEFSPATDSRNMPEPVTFPTAAAEQRAAADQFPGGGETQTQRRSRQVSQRLADELRYEDPAAAQQWRQSADMRAATPKQSMPRRRPSQVTIPAPLSPASQGRELRPPSVASGRSGRQQPYRPHSAASRASDMDSSVSGRRPPSSSQDWNFEVIPPSGPASTTLSPVAGGGELHMLSPNAVPADLPPLPPPSQPLAPTIPTVPNSPSMGRYPSMGALPDVQPGGAPHIMNLPPGFQPTGPVTPLGANAALSPSGPSRSNTPSIYGPPPPITQVPIQRSASSSSSHIAPPPSMSMHSRSRSVGGSSLSSAAGDELRSKTPVVRPSSSASSANRAGYPAAPTPAGVQYPSALALGGGSMSPRSAASRLSQHQGHTRSLSLNAGNTPAAPSNRPLSTAPPPKLRRVPSDASVDSAVSGLSRNSRNSGFDHYRPSEYVDPAFLASSEDLTGAGAGGGGGSVRGGGNRKSVGNGWPGTRPASRNSDALSYVSAQR